MANNLIDLSDVPDSGPEAQRAKIAATPVPSGIAAATVAQTPAPAAPKPAKGQEKSSGGLIDLSDVPEKVQTPAATPTTGGITGPLSGIVQRAKQGYQEAKTALTPQPGQPYRNPLGRAWDVAKGVGEVASAPFYPANYVGQVAGEWLTRHSGEYTDAKLDAKIARARELKAKLGSAAGASAEVNELPMLERIRQMPYEDRVKMSREAMGASIEGGVQLATGAAGAINPGWLFRAPGNITRLVRGAETAEQAAKGPLALRPEVADIIRAEEIAPKPRPAGTQQTLDEAQRILTGGQRGTQRTLEAAQDLQTGRGPLDLGTVGKRIAAERGTYQPASLAEKAPQSAAEARVATEKAMEEGGHAAKGSLFDPADAAPGWPRAKSWLHKTIDKYREGLPANLPLLKERPDSPVITIVRNHQANRTAQAVDLIEQRPWMKALLNGEPVEQFGPKFVRWEANGFKDAPAEIRQAMEYIGQQYKQEQAARLYLGDRELKEAASYWPRVREQDMSAVNVRGPIRGGLVGDVRTTLGAFEKSREYPTMQIGMLKGEKYIDPRRALLIRANTGHDLIETAGMLQDMEKAGVVSRGTNAFGKDGVELFKMPTGGSWWARGPAEARAIRDELTSLQHSSLANLSHGLNTFVRNPSLVNPAVHEVKNMFYKFVVSGGNPRKLAQYENEFRAAEGKFPYNIPGPKQVAQKVGISSESRRLVDQFLEVMPESRSATSAREVFGHAEFELEHPLATKAGSILRAPQQASHSYLFGTADPAIKYARWRQYVDKGMDAQTAANHVRIDLIDYGTRSQLIDFWKSVPGNFFVTWRTGTVQSLIKQARYHPVRTALLIGGVDYLREMAYRKTGYWLHLPIDYVEQPLSRVVADAIKKGPLQAGADAASIIATTSLLGPGGNPRAIQNLLQVATNPADLKNIKKVFWGLAQIFDVSNSLPDIMHAIDSGDSGKLAGYLQAFMAVAAFGVHKVKDDTKRPPTWTQLIPNTVPGMQRSPSQLADREKALVRQEQAAERQERARMKKEQE